MPVDKSNRTNDSASECSLCNDSGWKVVSMVDKFGRNGTKAVRCECQLRQQGQRLLEHARIPRRYGHCTLESFDDDPTRTGKPNASLALGKLAAGAFVENYPLERSGLIFVGPCGVGKTHLAIGAAKELIRQKQTKCLFYDYRELLKEIQNSYNATVQATELDVLKPVFEAEVLVLDEIGAVKATEWVTDTVSVILNNRYNDEKTTIITTNYRWAPSKIKEAEDRKANIGAGEFSRLESVGDRIGDRMWSRLNEMCRVVQMSGEDFRVTHRNASHQRLQ